MVDVPRTIASAQAHLDGFYPDTKTNPDQIIDIVSVEAAKENMYALSFFSY
jgi:hypothetical protein